MNLSLSKQPWYVQLGAFCALSLAAVVAFYFLYASPAQQDAAAKLKTLKRLRGEIEKGRVTERKLPQFNKEMKELETRLEGLKAVLPEEKDVGDLISRMQTLAMQSNLKIKSFKPGVIVPKQLHSELPHEVELDGTYHNFGTFLDRLSKLSRVINVSDISMRGVERPESMTTVAVRCTATTYVLLDTSKAGQQAKPAKKK